MTDRIDLLLSELHQFRDRRGWARFHAPKNLAMAMAAEAGEVLAELQWLTDEQVKAELSSPASDLRERLGDELADVLIYLLLLADAAGVDVLAAAASKNVRNESRFPPD